MFPKLAVSLIVAAAIGAALLGLRQQRVQTVSHMAALHAKMNGTRQSMWDTQVRIAQHANPQRLREALQRAGVEVEPIVVPARPRRALPTIAASHAHDRD
jgi:hypothetical protein